MPKANTAHALDAYSYYTGGHVNRLTRERNMNKRPVHPNQLDHNERYKQRTKETGIKQMRVMVPERDTEKVKAFCAELRYRWKIDRGNEED